MNVQRQSKGNKFYNKKRNFNEDPTKAVLLNGFSCPDGMKWPEYREMIYRAIQTYNCYIVRLDLPKFSKVGYLHLKTQEMAKRLIEKKRIKLVGMPIAVHVYAKSDKQKQREATRPPNSGRDTGYNTPLLDSPNDSYVDMRSVGGCSSDYNASSDSSPALRRKRDFENAQEFASTNQFKTGIEKIRRLSIEQEEQNERPKNCKSRQEDGSGIVDYNMNIVKSTNNTINYESNDNLKFENKPRTPELPNNDSPLMSIFNKTELPSIQQQNNNQEFNKASNIGNLNEILALAQQYVNQHLSIPSAVMTFRNVTDIVNECQRVAILMFLNGSNMDFINKHVHHSIMMTININKENC